jgi:hypothetical protein
MTETPKPPEVYEDLFKSAYLAAADFQGKPVTLTIKSVGLVEMASRKNEGELEQKPVLSFTNTERQIVLNKTNALCIKAMFGRVLAEWVGKRVTFRPEPDKSGKSEDGLCIRIMGSPDLRQPVDAEIKMPRKRAVIRKLIPTKTGAAEQTTFDPSTGEVDPDTVPDFEGDEA